jgi:hypothetical protein
MARLRSFQRPRWGGEGIRRANERIPLRGRRRCAAGMRKILHNMCGYRVNCPASVTNYKHYIFTCIVFYTWVPLLHIHTLKAYAFC